MNIKIILLFTLIINYSHAQMSYYLDDNVIELLLEYDKLQMAENSLYNSYENSEDVDLNLVEQEFLLIQERLNIIRPEIIEYLDYDGDIYDDVYLQLETHSYLLKDCSTNSDEGTISSLISNLTNVGRALEKKNILISANNLQGFQKRECSTVMNNNDDCIVSNTCECWSYDENFGQLYYITKGNFRINPNCLFEYKEGYRQTTGKFSEDPARLLESANSAAEQISSCYSKLNYENSISLASVLKNIMPTINCPHADPNDSQCAHVPSNRLEINLTNTERCNQLDSTIFHELMHVHDNVNFKQENSRSMLGYERDLYPGFDQVTDISDRIGNFPTSKHNDPYCRKYDAIYHCSYLCFGDLTEPPNHLSKDGCLKCVSDQNRNKCNKFDKNIMITNADLRCRY